MRRRLAAVLVLATGPALACDADFGRAIAAEGVTLAWRARPEPPPLAEPFAIEFAICGGRPDRITVDAVMPAHNHGMNYAPRLQETAAGRYRAEGLVLHMPGQWRMVFDLMLGGRALRLSSDFEVE